MTTYSDAANAFAESCPPITGRAAIAAAFDTGAATVPAEPITTAAERSRACPCMCHEGGPETDHGPRLTNGDSGRCACRRDSRADLHDNEALAPASPPVPEPVLLTADDPRIRDGAKCQWVDGPFVIGGGMVTASAVRASVRAGGATSNYMTLLLIAEAPDPDADKRQAVIEVLHGLGYQDVDGDEAGQILEALRDRGVAK
jgi:hypothetical protein